MPREAPPAGRPSADGRLRFSAAVAKDNIMMNRIPGVGTISRLFNRAESHKNARAAMARLLTQLEMNTMPFDSGIRATRRDTETRRSAIGTWLLPIPDGEDFAHLSLSSLVPAVTSDLRQDGFGILSTTPVATEKAILAVPDNEGIWRFFITSVRHCSPRPGHWYHAGLKIERLFEPTSEQSIEFRQRVLDTTEAGVPAEDAGSVDAAAMSSV